MQGTTEKSSDGPPWGSPVGPAQEFLMGTGIRLPVISVGRHAVSTVRSHSLSLARGHSER